MGLERQVECSSLVTVFGTLRGIGAVTVLALGARRRAQTRLDSRG